MDNKLSYSKDELYSKRLLIFLEEEPQSNKYRQIILDPINFKDISMSLGKGYKVGHNKEEVSLDLSNDIHELPDLPEITYKKK